MLQRALQVVLQEKIECHLYKDLQIYCQEAKLVFLHSDNSDSSIFQITVNYKNSFSSIICTFPPLRTWHRHGCHNVQV